MPTEKINLQQLHQSLAGIVMRTGTDDDRKLDREVSRLVEVRRAPLGKFYLVPRGTPDDPKISAELRLTDNAIYERKRKAKRARYLKKKNSPTYKGPIILAEGDSWFEYPCSKDVVEWLGERYAVLSLAKAGDAWTNILEQEGKKYDDRTPKGLRENVIAENPSIVLLSVGGNEIMGEIEKFVYMFDPKRDPDKYIIEEDFKSVLNYTEAHYRATCNWIVSRGAHVILHGYDYPDARSNVFSPPDLPQGGVWIGGPLEIYRHITDQTLWRRIANMMLDQWNARLATLANDPSRKIHYVPLLGTIGTSDYVHGPKRSYWHDEVHGEDGGFELLSRKIAAQIEAIAATN